MIVDVDLDGIVADFFGPLISQYNQRAISALHDPLSVEDIQSWDMSKHVSEPELLRRIFHEPGFFADLAPLPGAVSALRQLVELGHEVNIASACVTPHSFGEKAEWCRKHLPFIPISHIMLGAQKGRLRGDVLVDDGAHNARAYRQSNPLAKTYAIAWPHNLSEELVFDRLVYGYQEPARAWASIASLIDDRVIEVES